MLPLAINAEMSFPNLPFLDRVRTIHELGFRVGLWGLDHLDLDKLAATGAVFSMCDGFGGGNLVEPDAAEKMIASIEAMIPRVIDLGSPIMNLHCQIG